MLARTQAAGLWTLTVLSGLLFLVASYLGLSVITAPSTEIVSPFASAYGILWLLMPPLCIAGPLLGWRNARVGKMRPAFAFAILPLAGLVLSSSS